MPLGRKARQFCRSFSSSSFDPNGIDQKGRSEARDALCFPYGNSVRLALLILAYFVNRTLSRMPLKVLSYFSYPDCGATQTNETSPSGRNVVIIQSVSWPPSGESLLRYVARPGWPFKRTCSGWRVIFMFGFDFCRS